jgi:iron complex transport system ATP-binding protein
MIEAVKLRAAACGKEVLNCPRLSFDEGRFTAVVGPNGSGKSTLLRALCGLLSDKRDWDISGDVSIDGRSLFAMKRTNRARKLMYFPQTRPVPDMRVIEAVRHGRYPHRNPFGALGAEDCRAIDAALDVTGMRGFEDRALETLSGGERQRAWLAMMIAQDADTLLLDEPTTYLDISAQRDTLRIISGLASLGKTVICVLHDLPQAFSVAERLLILENGKPRVFGGPDDNQVQSAVTDVFGVAVRLAPPGALYRYELAERQR